jgi:hypothetical protein
MIEDEEMENAKIPCSLVEKNLITIKNHLISEDEHDEQYAAIIALRLKLRNGAIIRYDLDNHQTKWELGKKTLLNYMKRYFITEDDIPELRTNFPIMHRMCREADLKGRPISELEELDVNA